MADDDLKQLIRDHGGAGATQRNKMRAALSDDASFRRRVVDDKSSTTTYETKGGFPRVIVEEDNPEPSEECPPYLSGIVVNGWNAEKPDGAGGVVNDTLSFYPAQMYKPTLPREWKPIKYRGVPAGDPWRITFAKPYMGPENMLAAPSPPEPYTSYTASPQLAYIKPGLYTGKMRTVVQYMLGAKIRVNFDYHFYRSHGILEIKTPNGKIIPWVIEISRQHGVLASKLLHCTRRKDKYNPLGYTPLGSALPPVASKLDALISSGRVIQLLPPGAISDFYKNDPFFDECGWAFNYSGTEAQNTCWDWPDTYKRAYRYKIVITHDSAKPTGATMSLEDGGYMIGDTGGTNQLFAFSQVRFPNYGLIGNVTFDMTPEGVYSQPFDSICPLYVYYTGDEPQYVNWHNEMWRENTFPDLPPWSSFNPDDKDAYNVDEYMDLPQNAGKVGKYHQITSPIHDKPTDCFQDQAYRAKFARLYNTGFAAYWTTDQNGGTSNNSASRITNIDILTRTHTSRSYLVRHTVTIPLFDREGVYHMRMVIDDSPGSAASIAPYTVRHYDRYGTALYFYGPGWNAELSQIELPYRWIFTGNWSSPPNPDAGFYLMSDGHTESGIPERHWLTNFTGNSPGEPWVDLLVNNIRSTYYPSESSQSQDVRFIGSDMEVKTYPFAPAQYDAGDWLKISPDVMGWFSRMFVARSARGLYVISQREFEDDYDGDFDVSMNTYPPLEAGNVPHLTFLGNAEDKEVPDEDIA